MTTRHLALLVAALAAVLAPHAVVAQTPLGSAFTYQGQLKEGGLPFTGSANLRFQLYDADDGGMLVGSNSVPNVPINNGLFTVSLDFGSEAFFGDARWLETAVHQVGVGYVTLTPRQPLADAPYALYTPNGGGGGTSLLSQNGSNIFYTAGAVGVEASGPTYPLHIESAANGVEPLCAISGYVVSEGGSHHGWVVFDRDTGTIIDVCDHQADVPANARLIRHPGYIFPGLIDTHNHAHWNTVPMWRPGRTYDNRYEWRESQDYYDEVRSRYESVEDAGLWYESVKYAEIRAMIGGTTMIQGTDGADWGYLVRNLDYYGWLADSYVNDITQIDPFFLADIQWAFDEGYLHRLFLHVAEGKSTDPRTQAEFPFLVDAGLARPGVVIIHGIALTQEDFEIMAQNDMYLVWSPKSNDVLYGETANVVGAIEAGVTVALGPDWSITGSDNLLEELKVAYWYSLTHLGGAITPKQLFKMVTSDAAIVAGVDDPAWFRLGKIEPGYQADLFLAPRFHLDPHVSLLLTCPKDIRLVAVDGKPICGERVLMRNLVGVEDLDEIVIRYWKKAVDLIEPEIGPIAEQHYDEMLELFDTLPWDIAPLIEDEH